MLEERIPADSIRALLRSDGREFLSAPAAQKVLQ